MLRSLLVGVNGSQWSQVACEIAIRWARDLKIPLTCLGVCESGPPSSIESVPLSQTDMAAACDIGLSAMQRAKIKRALRDAGQHAAAAGISCHIIEVEGNPATLLGEEAQRHDLIILGRRACPHPSQGAAPSETLTEILRYSPRPIVLAGQEIPRSSHVIVAYDGSAQASRTLQSFVSSGLYYGHPLHLVGVGNSPNDVNRSLSRAVDYLNAHSLRAETHVLPIEVDVSQTLIDFARQTPTGLLVMGVYGQPWYKELLFGSVTRAVLAQFPAPLFLNH